MDGPFVTGQVHRDCNTMALCLIDTQLEYLRTKSAGNGGQVEAQQLYSPQITCIKQPAGILFMGPSGMSCDAAAVSGVAELHERARDGCDLIRARPGMYVRRLTTLSCVREHENSLSTCCDNKNL
jgi:hypothetical protein